jgi:carbon-monoxide dehydrogenase large subunit
MRTANTLIGQPMERVEDLRLLRGKGTFVADIVREGMLHAVIVRSQIAHGRLKGIDATAALAMPGVHAVITAQDLGQPAPRVPLRLQPLPELEPFHQPMLAATKVRYVGEPVAIVVADTQAIAEDAHDLVALDIETLPAITSKETADAAASLLFDEHKSNTAITWSAFKGDAAKAFADAPYTRKERFRVQRYAAMFMEPRGFVAEWDATAGKMTVWGAAKVAWTNRKILSQTLGIDESRIELLELDVGGGFGSRGEFYPEDFLIPFAAKHLGRPVKWVEDRREHLMTANHAREMECEVEIAATKDGRILALRGHAWTDNGAYLRTNGSVGPRNIAQFMSGPYRIEHLDLKTSMIVSNKTPCGTYRAPGRYEGDFVRERMIHLMAKDLGLDPVEVRRKNLVADAEMPYPLASITPYDSSTELDSGDNHAMMERCLTEFGWAERVKDQGKLIDGRRHGFAVGCFIEGGAAGPSEDARVVLEADGRVTVYMGSSAVGQGIETIMGQIAGDALELPFDRIKVEHGSTGMVANGFGSFHSRSTVMGGSAILVAADKFKTAVREAAATAWGCAAGDVRLDGERLTGPGSKAMTLAELAKTAPAPVDVTGTYYQKKYTYSYGTACVHVAVDAGTGHVQVLDLLTIKDCGRMINPLTLKGQGIGSMVQGLGGTFLEEFKYDSEGQLLTGSFADYLLPCASDFPNLRAVVTELKPSPTNPLGAKGAGEGEIVPIGGLLANAVANALGVEPMDLPLSPPKIWALAQRRVA